MRSLDRFVATLGFLAILGPFVPSAVAQWNVIDLGTLNAEGTTLAYGLNEVGEVVGDGMDPSPSTPLPPHAFRWESDPGMIDLGTLGDYNESIALDINEAGQVVGEGNGQPFIWDSVNGFTVIETGSILATGRAINDAGRVVGDMNPNAFMWESGSGLTDLGNLGGSGSTAHGINNAGQVVGHADLPERVSPIHAFLITPEGAVWFRDDDEDGINDLMVDLGTVAGLEHSQAYDINEHGNVAGASYNYPIDMARGFLYRDGAMEDLGSFGGDKTWAYGLNDANEVVGKADIANGDYHAFFWRDGVMYDLNELIPPGSGWELRSAEDINNAKWIVGYGTAPNGETHGFLLVPVPGPVPTVSAWGVVAMTLLILSAGTLVFRSRRPAHAWP